MESAANAEVVETIPRMGLSRQWWVMVADEASVLCANNEA